MKSIKNKVHGNITSIWDTCEHLVNPSFTDEANHYVFIFTWSLLTDYLMSVDGLIEDKYDNYETNQQ